MEKYIILAKKIVYIATKIIFAIAMMATVMAAFTTCGSVIRIELDFRDDAIPLLGLSVYTWFCFSASQEWKKRKTPLKTFFYDVVPFFLIVLVGFITMLSIKDSLWTIIWTVLFYVILICFLLKIVYAYFKFKSAKGENVHEKHSVKPPLGD